MKGHVDRSRGIEILIVNFFAKKLGRIYLRKVPYKKSLAKCTRCSALTHSPTSLRPYPSRKRDSRTVSIYERSRTYPFTRTLPRNRRGVDLEKCLEINSIY